MTTFLEFWPDVDDPNGPGPIRNRQDLTVDPGTLPLPEDLRERLRRFRATLDPATFNFDAATLDEGRRLAMETQAALPDTYVLDISPPWCAPEHEP